MTASPKPQRQSVDIDTLLKTVEIRLGETLDSFGVFKEINKLANKETNHALYDIIVSRGGFWEVVLLALQHTLFVGIYALVDKRQDSATLCSIASELNKIHSNAVPKEILHELKIIHDRYKDFRHKLFAHTDQQRDVFVSQFKLANFTWDSLSSDLATLQYSYTMLRHAFHGKAIPTRDEAELLSYVFSYSHKRVVEHTKELLQDIEHPPTQ